MSEQVFDELLRVVLFERGQSDAEPRNALLLRDPPVPCEVEVAAWLPDSRPRWMGVPLWARASGVDNHPRPGVLRGWLRTCRYELLGIVDVQLHAHARDGRLLLVLPCQLIPVRALRGMPDTTPPGLEEFDA
ncbi:hypothetical protein [Amycolatopsis sp. NPDC054798]